MEYDYNPSLNKNISDEDREQFMNMSVFIIILVVSIAFIMKKSNIFFDLGVLNKEVPPSLNSILFIGSDNTAKSTFFNYMIRGKFTRTDYSDNNETYTINNVKVFNKSKWLYDLMDVPLIQELRNDMLQSLNKTKLILCFNNHLDETSQDILFELITNANFNKETLIYIVANKDDSINQPLERSMDQGLKSLFKRLSESDLMNNIKIIESSLSTRYEELRNITEKILV